MSSTQTPEPKLTIKRRRETAQYFVEDLGHGITLDMVLIPAGSFLMGSPDDELERMERESPQHSVTLKTFFLGKYPITQAQWRAVAALPQVNRELDADPSEFEGDNRPVEQVSWLDAVEFCARLNRLVESRLSQHTGRSYRLPSEAEWEYACRASPLQTSGTPGSGEVRRAGTTTPFHFGETITTDLANYDGTDAADGRWSGSYGRGPKGIYRQETTPVGSFAVANAFGLYDMHGNVWEWCQDHWHGNYAGAPNDGSAWLDNQEHQNPEARRLLRGGSWINYPRICRSAYRYFNNADLRSNYIGFRVSCSA